MLEILLHQHRYPKLHRNVKIKRNTSSPTQIKSLRALKESLAAEHLNNKESCYSRINMTTDAFTALNILTPLNAKDYYLTWKNLVLINIRSIVPPKEYLGTRGLDKKMIYVLKPDDHILKDIPMPALENYSDEEEFVLAFQKWSCLENNIQKILASAVSDELRHLIIDASTVKAAWEAIATEVQHKADDHAERLKERLVRSKQKPNQSVFEYADETKSSLRELFRIWKPSLNILTEFEKDVIKYFTRGMTDDIFRRYIHDHVGRNKITSFSHVYDYIVEIKKEDESAAEHKGEITSNGIAMAANSNSIRNQRSFKQPNLKDYSKDNNFIEDVGTLRITNIPSDVTESQLQSVFKRVAAIQRCSLAKDSCGKHRGFGFVKFQKADDAKKRLLSKKAIEIKGQRLIITQNYRKRVNKEPGLMTSGEEFADFTVVNISDNTLDDNYSRATTNVFKTHVDSGCTPYHIANSTNQLTLTHNQPRIELSGVDGSRIPSLNVTGSIEGTTAANEIFQLKDMKIVPKATHSLLSVYRLLKDKYDVWFQHRDMSINIGYLDENAEHQIKAKGYEKNGLFTLNINREPPMALLFNGTISAKSPEEWHNRCMHYGMGTLRRTYKLNGVTGFNVKGEIPHSLECDGCLQGKLHNVPHLRLPKRSMAEGGNPLLYVSFDVLVFGNTSMSFTGNRYFLGITVPHANNFRIGFPLKEKSDVIPKLKYAQNFLECVTGHSLVHWFMDQGGESKEKTWRDECTKAGISIIETGKGEHQSNGLQEGFWNFALGCVRSTIAAAGVSTRYWDWALLEFTHVYN